MRKNTRIALIASLLSASALVAAAPAMAQEFHHAMGGAPHSAPGFSASPVHGAAPEHVLPHAGPSTGFRGGPGARGSMMVRPFSFQHHDFAHFTSTERAESQRGWSQPRRSHGRRV